MLARCAGEQWHGFSDADANHMFLDPVKVTILTPGMDEQGNMSEEDPAALVAKFLDERGIVVEKTGPYNLLFLFSIGIDKTKAMGLLRGLTEFKRSYDLNLRIKICCPISMQKIPISTAICVFRIWRKGSIS